MPSGPEARARSKLVSALRDRGFYVAIIHGGPFSAGVPDLLCAFPGTGRLLGLELKAKRVADVRKVVPLLPEEDPEIIGHPRKGRRGPRVGAWGPQAAAATGPVASATPAVAARAPFPGHFPPQDPLSSTDSAIEHGPDTDKTGSHFHPVSTVPKLRNGATPQPEAVTAPEFADRGASSAGPRLPAIYSEVAPGVLKVVKLSRGLSDIDKIDWRARLDNIGNRLFSARDTSKTMRGRPSIEVMKSITASEYFSRISKPSPLPTSLQVYALSAIANAGGISIQAIAYFDNARRSRWVLYSWDDISRPHFLATSPSAERVAEILKSI